MASKLKIIPLGGVAEIGKNMTAIEYGKDIIVIDCGSTFPSDEMLGIDLVIPDTTYLEKNVDRIRGILITHGHEDHIGALPFVLPKLNIPIYGSRLSLALINYKLEEQNIDNATLNCVSAGDVIKLGCFTIEFIKVGHSIAGVFGLAITTPAGVIIHTSDFKVDYTPMDGEPINLARFAEYGTKGVLALMSDSTNAERPGYTMSEKLIGVTFERYFSEAKGRVIVATFASNVHRVQQIIDVALRHGRKICLQGRSMVKIANMAMELGYMNLPPNMMVEVEKLKNVPDSEVCVITTGSQGEPMSGLVRMANSSHKLNVGNGDMVIISAKPIPGNEKTVARVIDQLFKNGAYVVYEAMADVHVSGHARQEELKLMISLVKPKFFIPVHGEYRHLYTHAHLAMDLGIDDKHVFIAEPGSIIELTRNSGRINGSVPAGSLLVDGLGIGDIGNVVLRDRKILSEDGLMVVVLTLKKETGELIAGPDVISRGFVYVRESEDLIDEVRRICTQQVLDYASGGNVEWSELKSKVRSALKTYLYNQTKRTPMILPIIIEI